MDPKTGITKIFDLVAEGYDNPMLRYFSFAGEQLAKRLKLRPGEQVLDIATGTGAFAAFAGQLIRPGGRVQAVDLSEGMLKKAQANITRLELDNVDFHRMDAEQLEFRSGCFDAIGCSFGIFFLTDMTAALAQWKKLLKPGGRLMFTSFAPSAFQPMTDILFEDLQTVGLQLPPEGPRTAADRLPSRDFCESLLESAGFGDSLSQSQQLGFYFENAESWWEVLWNAGFRGYLEQLGPDQFAEFRKIHLPRINALKNNDKIWLDVETWFSGGSRPYQS